MWDLEQLLNPSTPREYSKVQLATFKEDSKEAPAPEDPDAVLGQKSFSELKEDSRKYAIFSEEQLAGTWFNRLGILAIMLAVVFFLKWSFDNHIIGELGRVVIGILLGLGFLGAGEVFQRKNYSVYGQGFTGGGIAILYFSIFSAFAFYHLISQPVAFSFMILITAAASLLSLRYDSLSIGILGIVGGFVTPFLLNNGESNRILLLTYITILDAGVIAVAFYKKWPAFNYLTFFFTYLTFAVSHVFYTSERFPTVSFLFLSLFFVAYLGVSLGRNIRLREKANWADLALIFANAGVYFALSYGLLEKHLEFYMGYWSVFLGVIYLFIGNWTYKYHVKDRNLSFTFLGIAGGFITLAIPLQLTSNWLPVAWALESLVILALSFRMEEFKARLAGFLVLGLSIVSLVSEPFHITGEETWIFLHDTALAYLAVLATITAILILYRRSKRNYWDQGLFFGLQIGLNLMIILFFTQEISAYYDYRRVYTMAYKKLDFMAFQNAQDFTLSLVWGLHAGSLIGIGFWRRIKGIRWFALGFMGVVILKVFLHDLSSLSTPYRIVSFIVLGVILLGISWLYQRYKHLILGEMPDEKSHKV